LNVTPALPQPSRTAVHQLQSYFPITRLIGTQQSGSL
jgi:hypothetical protein